MEDLQTKLTSHISYQSSSSTKHNLRLIVNGNEIHKVAICDIEVGNPVIDQDHHALAQLIERVGMVCGNSLNPECQCDQCPEGKPKHCFASLIEIGHEIMVLMLDHFHHEDELMKSLPNNRSTKEHCVAHRLEHVHFSTKYNQSVAPINVRHPVVGLRTLDTFISDWIRNHIFEYDMQLAALLQDDSPSR
jgi:hemerythrin-like metal-binding protein